MGTIFRSGFLRLVVLLLAATGAQAQSSGSSVPQPAVTLPDHVLPALAGATLLANDRTAVKAGEEPLNLTVVLRRTDQDGFDEYLANVYDAESHQYRKFLSPEEIADRFGPMQQDYDAVRSYFVQRGFQVVDDSPNRLTLTLRASRADVEATLSVRMRDYKLGDRTFHANDTDPRLPADIAARVQAIAGLTNAGVPAVPRNQPVPILNDACDLLTGFSLASMPGVLYLSLFEGGLGLGGALLESLSFFFLPNIVTAAVAFGPISGTVLIVGGVLSTYCAAYAAGQGLVGMATAISNATRAATVKKSRPAAAASRVAAAPSNTQKVGLLEFDTFHPSDVQNWLALAGAGPSFANRLTQVAVNGGVASPGPGEAEVLLDIATVMAIDRSPNTQYVVYHGPANTSWQQMFNAMINDGVTVISNSWSDCEDQHTLADVQSIDAVLAAAAASGISVLNGSGDSGATCLDGSPNTVGVPASSPRATAVGGTTPKSAPGAMYGGETWWDGSAKVPPSGKGGFGTSRFFSRPAYQNGLTVSITRSVPDVAVNADPRTGLGLCQADAGGCPDGRMHGGTSMAAPTMAIMVANLNEVLGTNIGELNAAIYPLAASNAFHSAASMGTDFAHVGLGSPRVNQLRLLLSHQTIGPVDPSLSVVASSRVAVADGVSVALVQVNLLDANGYPLSGKNVTLTPSAGSHAVILPASGPTDLDSGAVVFRITNSTVEDVTFTARDATDGVTLAKTTKISFVAPPAASGGIVALPSTVAANGSSTTTITVTLLDANGQGAIGKTVTLSQGSGHSVITGPTPAVTNASGQVTFTATDTTAETVTYTAIDVTDSNLPVPGSASVTFTGGNASCLPAAPAAANGFTLIPFANGFVAQNFFFGNINFTGCPGASNPAFDASGNVFVSDFPTGDLYKFGLSGGAVSSANKLSNLGKTFGNLVIGKDGNLYGTTFSPSAIVQVDAVTGAVVKTVASGYTCPGSLAVDPLSGDLFFDDGCTGGGSDNPSIFRIQSPGSNAPTVVVYATLPQTPGGGLAFAPDGTLYAVANGFNNANSPVVRFTGTNTAAPHNGVVVQGITADTGGIAIGEVNPNGSAKSVIVHSGGAAGGVGGSLKLIDLTTLGATVLATGIVDPGVTGPDGCMYVNGHDTILKLVPTSGVCSFAPTNPSPALILSASSVTATQGAMVTLTAKVNNINTPTGTPVMFLMSGPNAQIKLGTTDANGVATVTVLGKFVGSDTVQATTAIGNTNLKSSLLRLTWNAGKHATFTTLNLSPNTGSTGTSVTLVASVSDVSVAPATALQGISVTLAIGAQSCNGVTDAQGNARCSVVVPSRPVAGPPLMLSANFAGNAQYTASSDSEPFVVVAAVGPSAPGAPTIGTATAGPGQASVAFTPPGSDGGSPITSYSATCTPAGGGGAVTATGASSPIVVPGLSAGVTYTCTVSATNSAGQGAPSASSNAVLILAVAAPQLPVNIPTLNVWMLSMLALMLLAMGAAGVARRGRNRG